MARDDAGSGRAEPGHEPSGTVQVGLGAWWPLRLGLPGKLLLLTVVFVMLAEVLIFVPSLANFRVTWLNDRIGAAHLAALAADAAPGGAIPNAVRDELLQTAQVQSIAIKRLGRRRMVLAPQEDLRIDATYDLRPMSDGVLERTRRRLAQIVDAMETFAMSPDWTMRVIGQPPPPRGALIASNSVFEPSDFVEIVLPGAPLVEAMYRFGLNILWLSIIISLITAALVYLALTALFVRPMMRLAQNMTRFREMPEDRSRIIEPSHRLDEIGITERELARMQGELAQTLQQKNRLAQLGLAVAKINHDLRNMLSTAQLLSDRMASLPDPTVQRFAPRLIASLDRAIAFCNDTLRYGQAQGTGPNRSRFLLYPLAVEVADGLDLPRERIGWQLEIDPSLEIDADRDQLFRVLNNLVRNACEALEALSDRPVGIVLRASSSSGTVRIEVCDNGPGVPEKALANLFQPFRGGVRRGGSGLGLAIASELVAAHGGILRHVPGRPGSIFMFDIADRSSAAVSAG